MKKENLYEPFSVGFETMEAYTKGPHTNTFFELVYVLSGSGSKIINGCEFDYSKDHLFLLTPTDHYSFVINQKSEFFFLRFNDVYLKTNVSLARKNAFLELVLKGAKDISGCILRNEADRTLIRQMIAIIKESALTDAYSKVIVQQFVNTIIIMIAKSISQSAPLKTERDFDEKVIEILVYIQKNIYFPERIGAEKISAHFKISKTNLGRYFKKHTNETLQQYTNHYKTRLIENQLRFGNKRINEIAGEFGFSDVSNFNKFFKRQNGVAPTIFRKNSRQKSNLHNQDN